MSFYFAHNGIHHATQAEEAAHNSGSLIFVAIGIAVLVAAALVIARRSSQSGEEGDEE